MPFGLCCFVPAYPPVTPWYRLPVRRATISLWLFLPCASQHKACQSLSGSSATTPLGTSTQASGHTRHTEKIAEEVREEARRGPFRFSDVGIPAGSRIQYIEDPSIEPEVIDDRHISYDGQTTSLSALAQSLKGFKHPVQGTVYFSFQGEILDDRRKRMEKEKS